MTAFYLCAAWEARAASLGLHPGDPSDLALASFRAGVPHPRSLGPFLAAEMPPLLDELEAAARRRRPRYEMSVSGITLTITATSGSVDNLTAAEVRALAQEAARAALLAEAERAHREDPLLPWSRIAFRLNVSPRTLNRMRAAGSGQKGPMVVPCAAQILPHDVVMDCFSAPDSTRRGDVRPSTCRSVAPRRRDARTTLAGPDRAALPALKGTS